MPLPEKAYRDPDVAFDVLDADDERRALDELMRATRAMRVLNLPIEIAPAAGRGSRELVNGFLEHVHRTHGHRPVAGWKWATVAWDEVCIVGAVVVSRPVSRHRDDGRTLEVTRLAVMEGPGQVATRLLGAVARAAKAQGFDRLVSYSLEGQDGTVYKAAGWECTGTTAGGTRRRGRGDDPELDPEDLEDLEGPKLRWEKALK